MKKIMLMAGVFGMMYFSAAAQTSCTCMKQANWNDKGTMDGRNGHLDYMNGSNGSLNGGEIGDVYYNGIVMNDNSQSGTMDKRNGFRDYMDGSNGSLNARGSGYDATYAVSKRGGTMHGRNGHLDYMNGSNGSLNGR